VVHTVRATAPALVPRPLAHHRMDLGVVSQGRGSTSIAPDPDTPPHASGGRVVVQAWVAQNVTFYQNAIFARLPWLAAPPPGIPTCTTRGRSVLATSTQVHTGARVLVSTATATPCAAGACTLRHFRLRLPPLNTVAFIAPQHRSVRDHPCVSPRASLAVHNDAIHGGTTKTATENIPVHHTSRQVGIATTVILPVPSLVSI